MAALSFEHFAFTYAGASHPAVEDSTWHVPQGAFMLLEGATGSGKSTLLRCAHPVLAPAGTRSGTVQVLGQPWNSISAQHDARGIAYVSQHAAEQIVCDSVWHEMAFGLENKGLDAGSIRQRVAEVAHYFGIESWFRRATNTLSGGQQQLLNLASALCMQPQLLLLDEPTAQLDPVAATDFAHALFRVNRELGITVVVATHDPWLLAPYATQRFQLPAPSRVQPPAASAHPTPSQAQPPAAATQPAPSQAQPPAASTHEPKPLLSFRDVSFSYGSRDETVLDGFTLDVEQGSAHALVGGNGSGKTTALLVAAGVQRPQRGKVRNHARAQAYLPQDPKALFACDTVAAELAEWQSACGYTDQDIAEALRAYGLEATVDQHPYDLSGGQQQMLALAKLLLTKPDLLLLDEPTKGLDASFRWQLGVVLREVRAAGTTIVLATHDLAFCRLFTDTASMIFDGQVSHTAPVDAFFKESLFFQPSVEALDCLVAAGEGQ